MNYKVLYRKYRPNDFENIIGQDYIIQTLKNSLINDKVSHAYIFSGPRGTGKTSTAKVFAKALNCENLHDGSPCNNCEFCLNFQENPDIIEIDAASNNGVDEIRNLIDNIKLTPTNGKYKVYIIDEVHMLSTSAFNALLLTLEEPPKHAIFILATTNIENVPITILSRCQRFDFQKITLQDIVKKLAEICKLENIEIENDALNEIAYLSEGGMRDSLSLLDQLSKVKEKITLEMIETNIKTISKKSVQDLINFVEKNDAENVVNLLNDFRVRGADYKSLIKRIIDIASIRARNIKINNKYERLNYIDYKDLVLKLSEAIVKINIHVDPFIIIEMILLDFISTDIIKENKFEKAFISEKMEEKKETAEIKAEIKVGKLPETNPSINSELINQRINNCFVNAQKTFLANIKTKMNDVLNSPLLEGRVKTILVDSNVVAASDRNLIFTCESECLVNDANEILKEIENVISNIINENYKIIFITSSMWDIEKKKYIDNLKINKVYKYIEENEEESEDETDILEDIFDASKVEVI